MVSGSKRLNDVLVSQTPSELSTKTQGQGIDLQVGLLNFSLKIKIFGYYENEIVHCNLEIARYSSRE